MSVRGCAEVSGKKDERSAPSADEDLRRLWLPPDVINKRSESPSRFFDFLNETKDEVTDLLNDLAKPQSERKPWILEGALKCLPEDLIERVRACSEDDAALYVLGKYDPRLYPTHDPKLRDMQKELLDLLREKKVRAIQKQKAPGRGRRAKDFTTLKVNEYLEEHPDYDLVSKLEKADDRNALRAVGADLCSRVFSEEVVSPARLATVQRIVRDKKKAVDKSKAKDR